MANPAALVASGYNKARGVINGGLERFARKDPEETKRLEEIAKLERIVKNEDNELREAQDYESWLKKELDAGHRRTDELNGAIKKLEQDGKTVEEDLAATMQDARDEGRMSAKDGLEQFLTLMESITKLADSIFSTYQKVLDVYFKDDEYNRFLTALSKNALLPDLHKFLLYYEKRKYDLPMQSIAYLMLHHILFHGIQRCVFGAHFIPGQSKDNPEARILSEIYSSILSKESQGDRLRWKALTLNHVHLPSDWNPSATSITKDIATIISWVARIQIDEKEICAAIASRLEDAAMLRQLLEQQCVDGDFVVYIQPSNTAKRIHLDNVETISPSDIPKSTLACVLGTSWGVECVQRSQKNGGEEVVSIGWITPKAFTTQSTLRYVLPQPT